MKFRARIYYKVLNFGCQEEFLLRNIKNQLNSLYLILECQSQNKGLILMGKLEKMTLQPGDFIIDYIQILFFIFSK
jgi:hypothetical protein